MIAPSDDTAAGWQGPFFTLTQRSQTSYRLPGQASNCGEAEIESGEAETGKGLGHSISLW